MTTQRRQGLLAAALVATLLAAWFAPEGPEDAGTAAAALAPMPALLDWPAAPQLIEDVSANGATEAASADARRGGREGAAPRGVAATAADRAVPPPLPTPPFRMFGRLERDGEAVAFVSHAGRTLTVMAGQELPGDWHVESIGNDGMVLTYLPLGQTARIPFKAPAQ